MSETCDRCADPDTLVISKENATAAWIGETSVDEVSDLVWDRHAEIIDVSKMDPVWVVSRDL